MAIVITYFCSGVESKVDELVFTEQKDNLSAFIDQVNGVDKLFSSFALTHQGKVIFLNGGFGCVETSSSGLKDLHNLVETAKGLIAQEIAIGIGQDLKTSSIACSYCLNQRDSQKPIIFQPGMERCLDGEELVSKAEGETPNQEAPVGEDNPENQMMQLIAQSLDKVKNSKDFIERIREVNPEAYEAIKSIVSSMILMAQSVMPQPSETGEPEPAPTQKSEGLEKDNVKGFRPIMQGPVRRKAGKGPRRRLLPGTVKGGKVKTIDPKTGKAVWKVAARKTTQRF
jgi:hypothetical protein